MTAAAAPPRYFKGLGAQVAEFMETWIIQTKGRWAGQPLHLEPWERELLDELYLVDHLGQRVYREGLVGLARKNGKSTFGSGIALHGLIAAGENAPEVYAAAASKDQARVVFNQAREMVEASPKLREWLKPYRNVISCEANGGVFRVLSSDAKLQHGLNASLVVIDELWAHKDPELYYALTTGQLARENPLVVSITTAGWDRDSICWLVFQHGEALAAKGIDAQRAERFLHRWFAAPASARVEDESHWSDANPASWITQEALARERRRLPENIFRRLHLNQWTEAEDAWIVPRAWDDCAGRPQIDFNRQFWVAVDLGIRRDSTAFVWAQWASDAENAKLNIGQEIWTPDNKAKFDVADVREYLAKWAASKAGLQGAPYDPWSFRESAEILLDRGLPMIEWPQNNARMCPASETVYELIENRRIEHDGDEEMRQQILAAVVMDTERGWRISKRKSLQRIDAAVTLAMVCDVAVEMRKPPPPRTTVIY